jgi:hypothetical protein
MGPDARTPEIEAGRSVRLAGSERKPNGRGPPHRGTDDEQFDAEETATGPRERSTDNGR